MGPRGTITAYYGLTGMLNALWGAALPATDARLDLGAGRLGGVLMALAAAALVAMPVAGRLAERWTGRGLLRLTGPGAAVALAASAPAPSLAVLMISAVVVGLLFGALNVALSVQAVAAERAVGRPIMATLHGTWTLGAVTGGVVISAGLHLGAGIQVLMPLGALTVAAAMLTGGRTLVPTSPPPAHPPGGSTLRPGLVIMLGAIGVAAFITEGAATDWAGVHATRVLGADPATGSLMYTVFFTAMTLVRFIGDAVRTRLRPTVTIRLAGGTATAGYALILLAGTLPHAISITVALTAWALIGAGMAIVWPMVISSLGTINASTRHLAAVTTISYGGGLLGPALISLLATAASLPLALLLPAALALAVATIAPLALRRIMYLDSYVTT